MPADATIDEYVAALGRRLRGPRRPKTDLVREVRHSLTDAAEAYVDSGLDPRTAQSRAVADFGALDDLVPAYQAELAAGYGRRLALVLVLLPVGMLTADSLWWQPPGEPSPPPTGFLFMVEALDWTSYAVGALSLLAYLLLGVGTRRYALTPRTVVRPLAALAVVACGLIWSLGTVAAVGAVQESPQALAWPPMIAAWIMLNA
ncbi:MAG TPA: permease prefix domain 1-containing protein, partial [Micromonosporaceae bacterium]|nr:permease prefix domain 1-containing protein [Micromonosporaceae bacterium]